MNRGRRETALAQVDRDVAADIEAKFENERQQILRVRRADAELSMQHGKTLIHEALADLRREQSDAEARLLESWNARLLEVVDANRKVDIARAEALAESLARTNAVEDERRQANERIETLRAEHAARVVELEARVEQARQDAVAELRRVEADWERKIGEEREKAEESKSYATKLQDQMTGLSASIHAQYQERVDALRESRDSMAEEMELANKATNRMQKVLIFLLIVLVVAALAIGGIAGWVMARMNAASTDALAAAHDLATATMIALGS
jgi:hypothetical protein